jgi:hypothetical protein
MTNIILDTEQTSIIEAIRCGKNISINAVFGSGKTTTILKTTECYTDKQSILVTYNTHLKNEVHEKIIFQGLSNNIQVYTYHSLCMRYFGYGKNDEELQMYHHLPPKIPLPTIDILFIDEKQDMTLVLYTFIRKFLYYLPKSPQLVICGDHLQGVYQFKGADKRFLTLGSEIYQRTLEKFEMTKSYRLTRPMGWLINECIYGKKILETVKDGPPIIFFNQSRFSVAYSIVEKLKSCLARGIKAEDIFVLAPSLKGGVNMPLKTLENLIYEKLRLPIFYTTNEEGELNDKVIQKKVVFSTFHQSKGRERKVVIVFGFDDSYFDFYAKDEDRLTCPSTLIVALSRAKEMLMIVKDVEQKPFTFMKQSILEMSKCPYFELIGSISNYCVSKRTISLSEPHRKTSVTDLVKYIKTDIQTKLMEYKNRLFEKKSDQVHVVEIDPFVENQLNLFEDVSDLIGIVIPSIFEEQQTGQSHVKEKLLEWKDKKMSDFMKDKLDKVRYDSTMIEDLLYSVKVYKSLHVGIYSPFQVDRDNWLSAEQMMGILSNMNYHIKDRQLYEYDFHEDGKKFYDHPTFGKICITGRIDSLDRNVVWEFKCVRELTFEHFLQVICYQWLWKLCLRDKYGERVFRLLNIRTGEMYEMINDDNLVQEVIDLLIENRYQKMIPISDKEFIESCLAVFIEDD